MVSFSCEVCNDTLTKKKLDQHRNQCRGATFTCLDCMTHFWGTEYRSHTSCISEAQKYQGHLYRDKKAKIDKDKSNTTSMVPRKAYVEDASDVGDVSQAVAIVDVPPKAPTPPPAEPPQAINVFDFLVDAATPGAQAVSKSQSQNSYDADASYIQNGFAYGHTPVQPTLGRYDSAPSLFDARSSFVTPVSKDHRREKKEKQASEKKRKRNVVEELDLSSSRDPSSRDEPMSDVAVTGLTPGRVLHSGLTGGLSRLVTDGDFYSDRIDAGPTPVDTKRSKRRGGAAVAEDDTAAAKNERRRSTYVSFGPVTSKAPATKHQPPTHDRTSPQQHDERRRRRRHRSISSEDSGSARPPVRKAIDYPTRTGAVQPLVNNNQLIGLRARTDLFMSFVKGAESQHGTSINKVLKRYHRERDVHGDERDDEDKELWKSLRLRKNDRGEIVLFVE